MLKNLKNSGNKILFFEISEAAKYTGGEKQYRPVLNYSIISAETVDSITDYS
jgi:hypothetical protein